MKIVEASFNNRKKAFRVRTHKESYEFPYSRLRLKPTARNTIVSVMIDPELGKEAFTYELASGASDSIHLDAVLDYNKDTDHLRELLLYKLTLQAQSCIRKQKLSKRELTRKLKTSPTQLYRLLDQTFYGKTIDQMIKLLAALECSVDLVFKKAA